MLAPQSLALGASGKSMAKSEIRRFLKEIRTKFPDVVPLMEKHESWALTFLMGEFANLTKAKEGLVKPRVFTHRGGQNNGENITGQHT